MIERIIRKIYQIKFDKFMFKEKGSGCRVGKGCTVRNPEHISMGNNVSFGDYCNIQTWPIYRGESTGMVPKLAIGNKVSFMERCHVSCMNSITIDDGCLFGDNTFITDNFHGKSIEEELDILPIERKLFSKGSVEIGKNVWIGRNVCIMPGVKIGNGAILAANAVVTKNIPPNVVAAGVPAKVVKVMRKKQI